MDGFSTVANSETCQAHTVCDATQYESASPSTTTDRVCSLPTTCVAGTYISTAHTATTDRSCSPCVDGFSTVANSETCQAHTVCDATHYESASPSTTTDRVCSLQTTCDATHYESAPPSTTTDRVCSLLTTCVAGEYISTADTATTDRACSPCVDGFSTVANSATCEAYTTCNATQYESASPSTTTDRVCSLPTTCVAGTYISTAHTATTDQVCSPCVDGTFTAVANSATCEAHSSTSCAEGEYEVLGSTTADAGCSPCLLTGLTGSDWIPDANGHANIHGTVVPANAYKDCSMLTSITISPATTTISEGAFLNTGLVSVDVPDTVTAIGNTAFGSTTEISAPCCASLVSDSDATILGSEQFLTTYDLDLKGALKTTTPPGGSIVHRFSCGYCVGGYESSSYHYGDFTCDGDGNLVNEGGAHQNSVCVDKTGAPESEWVETTGKCLLRCVPKANSLGFQSAARVLTLPTYDPNSPHYTDLNDFKSKVDASLSATINHPSSTFVVKNCGANFNYDRCVGVGNVGCTDAGFLEYSSTATSDDGSCATPKIEGCTYDSFDNHIANANYDDGTCETLSVLSDCTALKNAAEGACTKGCMYDSFDNHNPASTYDDGTCATLSVLSDCNALTTAASSACDATNNRVCVERVVYN